MPPEHTWVRGLAEFSHDLSLASCPPEVIRQARLCVLDTIGCIVAGADNPNVARLVDVERGIDPREQATVPGLGVKLPLEAAARVSAYMGDLYEMNDLVGGHASIACIPAALALAEVNGSSPELFLEAVIAGDEVVAAVYEATWEGSSPENMITYSRPWTEVSLGPVTVPSSVGAAATAAKLMRLDLERTSHALAIAVVLAAYSAAEGVFRDGGTTKPLLFGPWPAYIGIRAASYAAGGLTGPLKVLESDAGYYNTISRPGYREPSPGKPWRLERPRRKWHANCGFFHSAMDTLIDLRRQGLPLAEAREIRVGVPDYVVPLVSKPQPPRSPEETLFHAQYNFALAATGVDVVEPRHSMEFARYCARPDVAGMMRKFTLYHHPDLQHSLCSLLTVVGGDGQVIAEVQNNTPKGSAANPISDAELVEKFIRCIGSRMSRDEIDRFVSRVLDLESQPDCRWLVQGFDDRRPAAAEGGTAASDSSRLTDFVDNSHVRETGLEMRNGRIS